MRMDARLALWVSSFVYFLPVVVDAKETNNWPAILDGYPPSATTVLAKYFLIRQKRIRGGKYLRQNDEKIMGSFFGHDALRQANVELNVTTYDPRKKYKTEDVITTAVPNDQPTSPHPYQLYQKCRTRSIFTDKPLLLIASCPRWYPDIAVRRYCETVENVPRGNKGHDATDIYALPVSDNEGNGFANRFCALCHGVSKVKSWKFTFECEGDVLDKIKMDSVGLLNKCGLNAILPFSLHEKVCDNVDDTRDWKLSLMRKRRSANTPTKNDYFPVSFSILMNFGFDGKAHILFSESHHIIETPVGLSCPESQIFDPSQRKCRPVVCDTGYVLKKQKCVQISTTKATPKPRANEAMIADDIAQVSLELNVSMEDYFLLFSKSFQSMMISEIGSLFNISVSRIQNFTIQPLQGPGSGNILEIHKYTENENLNHKDGLSVNESERHVSQKRRKRQRFKNTTNLNFPQKLAKLPPDCKPVDVTEYIVNKGFLDAIINFFRVSEEEGTAEDNGIVPSSPTTMLPTLRQDMSQTTPQETTSVNPTFNSREKHHQKSKKSGRSVVVKMSFLLMPPTQAKEETSVEKAVEEMTHLVSDKRFKVNVNNTRISVINIVNEGEPVSVSNWCKKGVVNAYGDNQFELLTVENPTTSENETVVYVNETGDVYWRGQFDLMVLVEGSLYELANSNLSGYVFVCTMPRIIDSPCPKVVLEKDEYAVLNHDRVIVDIYTNTKRSIYEYRLIGNDSVEICMPYLADKSCGRIELNPSEYVILYNKSIIYSGQLYNTRQYQASGNGSVEICIPKNYFEDRLETNITDEVTGCNLARYKGWFKAEIYLTATLSLISILSMAAVLITYCLFPKLRNLPGVNTVNLTLALFIAEMVFEFGSSSGDNAICTTVAVTLHYFFLASFFWMNVMAYDVYRTFANSCVLTRIRSKSKYLPRYALYAWGCPAFVVVVCCFIDFTCVFEQIHINYGRKDSEVLAGSPNLSSVLLNDTYFSQDYQSRRLGCWIQDPMAALAAFGGPVFLILLANAIFYVKAIICIRSTTRSSVKNTRRSAQRRLTGQNDVIIYVRMSTVMGFTWIIGFTSSFISSVASDGGATICLVLRILTILFTLFNCSQGFLIFFVFVFNRRVSRLYKQLLLRKCYAYRQYFARHGTDSSDGQPATISRIY